MTGCNSSDVKSTRASLARLANDVSETVGADRPFLPLVPIVAGVRFRLRYVTVAGVKRIVFGPWPSLPVAV